MRMCHEKQHTGRRGASSSSSRKQAQTHQQTSQSLRISRYNTARQARFLRTLGQRQVARLANKGFYARARIAAFKQAAPFFLLGTMLLRDPNLSHVDATLRLLDDEDPWVRDNRSYHGRLWAKGHAQTSSLCTRMTEPIANKVVAFLQMPDWIEWSKAYQGAMDVIMPAVHRLPREMVPDVSGRGPVLAAYGAFVGAIRAFWTSVLVQVQSGQPGFPNASNAAGPRLTLRLAEDTQRQAALQAEFQPVLLRIAALKATLKESSSDQLQRFEGMRHMFQFDLSANKHARKTKGKEIEHILQLSAYSRLNEAWAEMTCCLSCNKLDSDASVAAMLCVQVALLASAPHVVNLLSANTRSDCIAAANIARTCFNSAWRTDHVLRCGCNVDKLGLDPGSPLSKTRRRDEMESIKLALLSGVSNVGEVDCCLFARSCFTNDEIVRLGWYLLDTDRIRAETKSTIRTAYHFPYTSMRSSTSHIRWLEAYGSKSSGASDRAQLPSQQPHVWINRWPNWLEARQGLITASQFGAAMGRFDGHAHRDDDDVVLLLPTPRLASEEDSAIVVRERLQFRNIATWH